MASPCRRPIRLHLTGGAAFAALLLMSAACDPAAAYTPPGKKEKAVKSDIQYIRCVLVIATAAFLGEPDGASAIAVIASYALRAAGVAFARRWRRMRIGRSDPCVITGQARRCVRACVRARVRCIISTLHLPGTAGVQKFAPISLGRRLVHCQLLCEHGRQSMQFSK